MKRKHVLCALALIVLLCGGCSNQQGQLGYIGVEEAKRLALADLGVSADRVEFTAADLASRGGTDYYQVDFTAGGSAYRYDIDALTGVVIESWSPNTSTGQDPAAPPEGSLVNDADTYGTIPPNTDPSQSGTGSGAEGNTGTVISAEEAKVMALAHAGLLVDQVAFTKCRLSYEEGRQIYDVEFYSNDYREYDYELDPYTGAVIKFSYESPAPSYTGGGSTITEERAKELALSQVPGATASDIWKFKLDYDDGRMEYEGTIIYNSMKYEFTIDAYSSTFRSWEGKRMI